MRNTLLNTLLVGALCAATLGMAAAQTAPTPTSKKEMKEQRKLRRQKAPEVYKGSVARERRIVTEYPGAEKEEATSKKDKKRDKQ